MSPSHIAPEDHLLAPGADRSLPRPLSDPAHYIASPALAQAVKVAQALGMPLLLTGDPGTGKTQLAYRLAWELGHGAAGAKPLRFDTKSTSTATDLFYQFDSVRHYAASQLAAVNEQQPPPARQFIHYRALGLALLKTRPWADNQTLVSDRQADDDRLRQATPHRSVVLIDEVDKAPRDFPNDLLNQLDEYCFDAPELSPEPDAWGIRADPDRLPIVIITSNSERQLPEAFLRRCVYHHISLPVDDVERRTWLHRIVQQRFAGSRLADAAGSGWDEANSFFFSLLDERSLQKPPSTAELLDWLRALDQLKLDWAQRLPRQRDALMASLGVLLKTTDDLATGQRLWALR